MNKMITPEEVAEAKKNGQAVIYGLRDGKLVPIQILSKEETRKADEDWDDEFHCPKRVAEFWRRAREWERERKKM